MTLSVTTTDDAVDVAVGDGACETNAGECSLRAALQEANASSAADTVLLPAGAYVLAVAPGGDDAATGDLDVTAPLTIVGVGADLSIIDANDLDRVLEVHPSAGSVTLRNLALTNGSTAEDGGGIYSASERTLRLEGVAVTSSSSEVEGGGIHSATGTLIVSGGSRISDNVARTGGGIYGAGEPTPSGLQARVTLTAATISGNSSVAGGGGVAVVHEGDLAVSDVVLTGNTTEGDGGGIAVTSKTGFSLSGGSLSGNTALGSGGGLYTAVEGAATIAGVEVTGNAAGTDDGGSGGGLYVGGSGPATVRDVTVADNSAAEEGGGIHLENTSSVGVSDSVVRGNSAAAGGGIENGAMRVMLERLEVTGNEAAHDGGGIESQGSGTFTIVDTTISANVAENGGGFANSADGTLNMSRTTIWNNRAELRFEDDSGLGGGVYGLGDASATYENVTIAGNFAQVRGGGLYIDADADVHVFSTTIAHNTSPVASGVGGEIGSVNFPVQPSTSVIFGNTIVAANNLGDNCSFAIGSVGGNIDDGDTCYFRGPRDRAQAGSVGIDAIADNGGPTMTMALRTGSLAIDGGVAPCVATDQRGITRPLNERCDSGAFEYEGPFDPADLVPPDTQYVSGPDQDTESTSAFTFAGTDDVTPPEDLLFECRLLESDPTEPPEVPDPTQPVDPALAFVGCPNPWQVPLIEEGTFTFEVRAIDRAGNVDPTPAVHEFEGVDDVTPPVAVFVETPPNPSSRNVATFTFAATDDHTPAQFLEFECRVDSTDPAAWLECTNPLVLSNLTVGEHTVQVRAADGADNLGPVATYTWTVVPALTCDDANITLGAEADVFVDQENPLANLALSPELVVRSAPLGTNARALVRFPAHVLPDDGCALERATLRLAGEGDAGRTLEALPAADGWSESQVTWNTQPSTAGAAASTTSGSGYREWDVTTHVAAILDGSAPNHGWVIRDASEGDADGAAQAFLSREAVTDPPTPPQLVLRFAAAGTPAPPAPEPAATPTEVVCGQVLTESTLLANDLVSCLGEGLVIGAPNIVLDLGGHTISSGAPLEPGEEDGMLAGIRNSGHANVVVRGGTVTGFGYGVRIMAGAIYNVVEGMTLRSNVIAGVELVDADNGRNGNLVRGNDFRLNGDGVAVVGGSENSVIEGNSFTGNLGRAVYLFDARGHRIEGNVVSGDTGDPLLDSDGGVYLEASTDVQVIGNAVADTGDAAFLISEGSHRARLVGNTSTRTSDSAISVAASDDVEIEDNVLHQAGGAAIAVSGAAGGLIRGNDVRFNPGGIQLGGTSGYRLDGNDASFTLADGITIEAGLQNVVLGNLANHTRATGIAVEGEAVDAQGNPLGGNIVEGNDTTGNLGDGIAVNGAGHTVTANTAYNNAGWGISAAEGTIDGGGNLASGNAEPGQCTGVVCSPGTAPPATAADTTAPETELLGWPPDGASSLEPSTFTFTGSDDTAPTSALRFECRLDAPPDPEPEPPDPPDPGDPPEPVEPPSVDNWSECGSPHTYPLLFTGEHTFEVRAVDPFDNVDLTPATYNWTVTPAPPGADNVPPSTTIVLAPSDPSTSTSASFSFRGSDNSTPGPSLTYECRLVDSVFQACTSPATYADLALGTHTFEVRTVDAVGNVDETPASHTWTVVEPAPDTTPPDTAIDSGPDLTTVVTSATFTFSATSPDDDDTTFECRLDSAQDTDFVPCTSPWTLDGLDVGTHTFDVRAVDDDDNADPTPATYTWTVTDPPIATAVVCGQVLTESTLVTNDLTDCPENGLVVGADSITIDLGGSMIDGTGLGAGVLVAGYDSVTITGGIVQEFDYGVALTAGTALAVVDGLELSLNQLAGVHLADADDGTNGVVVRDNLAAGNLTGIELVQGTQHARVHGNTVAGAGGVGILLDHSSDNRVENNEISATSDAGLALSAASRNLLRGNSVSGTADEAVVVADGSNGNRVEANSVGQSDAGLHVLDSDANEIVGNVANGMSDNGITLENAHGSLLLDNDVRFNGTGIGVDASSGNRVEGNDASESGTGIEVGDFSLTNVIRSNLANANDSVGISIGGSAPGGSGNLVEGNTANGNSGDGIYIGAVGHMIRGNSANTNGGWGIYASAPSPEGVNVDGGGNRAMGNVELEQCYNVACDGGPGLANDPVPPDTSITGGPDDPTSSRSATFAFTGSDNATPVTFECRLDSIDAGDFTTCTSPVTFTGLAVGQHTFEVRAVDWSGNIDPTPDAWVWTIEPKPVGVAPETTIASGPDLTTVSTSATFDFSSNEDDATFECRLDSTAEADFAPCTSPQTYAGLAVGPHAFEVRAIDDEGLVDATPATYTWTITAAPTPAAVTCGQVLTVSTRVTNDLQDCLGDGLVIGADGITLDLGGHTIDGVGLGAGVRNPGFDHVAITNGVVQEFDHGVALEPGTTHGVVASVRAQVNQETGVLLTGVGEGTSVRTSTISENTQGILLTGGTTGVRVHDNDVDGSAGDGIRVDGASHGNVIERNLVAGSSQSGVALEGADGSIVLDNTLTTNSGAGISALAGADNSRIEGNTISASGSAGIVVEEATGTEILANTVSTSGGSGVELAFATGAIVRSNDLRFNAGGIDAVDSSDNLIRANNASGQSGTGIALEGASLRNTLVLNTVNGNSGQGIYLAGAAATGDGNLIDRNTASNNSGDGISVSDGGHTVTANTADFNDGWGIFAAPGTVDGGGNAATGNAEPTQCSGVVCLIGVHPGAPDTSFVLTPPAVSNSRNATFTFTGSDDTTPTASLGFECRLDSTSDADWVECENPHEITDLAPGEHTLDVRAVDAVEVVDPSPASYTWEYVPLPSGVAPDTVIDIKPAATTPRLEALFTFSSNEPDVTFECELDGAGWEPCALAFEVEFEETQVGPHTFRVRATDIEGLTDPTPAVWNWTITGVLTTFTTGPDAETTETTATIDFTANVDATFACSLDLGPFEPCEPPVTYTGLAIGEHLLRVVATDAETGVEELEPAEYGWEILPDLDVTPPQTTITNAPLDGSMGVTLFFTGSDDQTPAEGLEFECALDGSAEGDFVACTSPFNLLTVYPDLAPGTHTFYVRALDREGNVDPTPAFHEWESAADDVPPATTLQVAPSEPTLLIGSTLTLTFAGSDNATPADLLAFECSLDGGTTWEACTSPLEVQGLGGGEHALAVRAIDLSGNPDTTPATWTVTVVDPPETTIDAAPATPTTETSATFEFSSDQAGSTFACSLNDGPFEACASPFTVDGLGGGTYSFAVAATNPSGLVDETPAEHQWVVEAAPDTTPPDTAISTGPASPTTNTTATFALTSTEIGATFECSLDAAGFSSCASPFEVTGLAKGEHVLEVRAIDAVGNADLTPATYAWTVLGPPVVTVTAGPVEETEATSATFEFTSDEPGTTFECWLDGVTTTGCTSPVTVTGLAVGEHEFAVRGTANGLTSPEWTSHEWAVLASVPPDTAIDSGPSGATTSTSASFTFSATEAGSTFECDLDAGGFGPCTSPYEVTGLGVGTHTLSVRAVDGGGAADPTPATQIWTVEAPPPACTASSTVTVTATADAWVDQGSPSSNKGSDSVLKVMSKGGANLRGLVAFALPTPPDGCIIEQATLRLNAASQRNGRTLEVLRVTGPWTENGVTWSNQPATTGPAATTSSGSGWREWAVTSQVQAMYGAGGVGSFLVKDAVEGRDHEQQFRSREAGSNPPQLVVRFAPPPVADTTPPDTTITSGPGLGATATFQFTSNEAGSAFECSLDGAAFATCVSPVSYAGLAVGSSHTLQVRAKDAAGNVDPTPASSTWTVPIDCGPAVTVQADRDAWIDQSSPSQNKGDDSVLKVRSKSGNQAARALLGFTLPAAPAGCAVDAATLRLYSDSAVDGRTLEVYRLTGSWTESGVTWANQPTSAGAAASTTAAKGWREWAVIDHVREMYGAAGNHGFLLRDAVETADAEQSFHSSEKGSEPPQLVVRFAPTGG